MDIIDNVSDGVIIEVNETPIKIQVLKNRQ
jgi:hypothetical protein